MAAPSQPLLPVSSLCPPYSGPGSYLLRARTHGLLFISKKVVPALLLFATLGHLSIMPVIRAYQTIRSDISGLEVHRLAISVKVVEALLAAMSITLVMIVYTTLIRRSTLLSTTAIYPRTAIERNIGRLLTEAWPDCSSNVTQLDSQSREGSTSGTHAPPNRHGRIRLLYLGQLTEEQDIVYAKGLDQVRAEPGPAMTKSGSWLTSGSPLTKSIVQLLIWEWASIWLLLLMILTTLMFNGFFTGDLSVDSYPRLTIVLIYSVGYLAHCCFVTRIVSRFFTNVSAGAAWSLLERANFAICHAHKIEHHKWGNTFQFDSIDKASAEHVPTTYHAFFRHEHAEERLEDSNISTRPRPSREVDPPTLDALVISRGEKVKDVKSALATLKAAQENERTTAREAAEMALERVITNATILMGITLSSGFSSWTASQTTSDSPNNFNTSQIGSLALLASLSLGAAAMFTSAMHLTSMNSSFRTILSLKEIKINGQAVDHVKKRTSIRPVLSFTSHEEGDDDDVAQSHTRRLKAATIGLLDILATNKISHLFRTLLYGPAYALLPNERDHARISANLQYSLCANVRGSKVIFTTHGTDKHARNPDGTNVESINVCYVGVYDMKEKRPNRRRLSRDVLERDVVGEKAV